jgi:hypothetical protein
MRCRRRSLLACAVAGLAVTPAAARDTLGIYQSWGAFRDTAPRRCFAMAQPARGRTRGLWLPSVGIGTWPERGVRGQIHVRLRFRKLPGAPVTLTIGDKRFRLIAGGSDAWARNARQDAAIVAAMRSGSSMSIETRSNNGRAFADVYRLRGAATAIDAAALGCTKS